MAPLAGDLDWSEAWVQPPFVAKDWVQIHSLQAEGEKGLNGCIVQVVDYELDGRVLVAVHGEQKYVQFENLKKAGAAAVAKRGITASMSTARRVLSQARTRTASRSADKSKKSRGAAETILPHESCLVAAISV